MNDFGIAEPVFADFFFSTSRFEQLTLRANSLREELHTEIEKMLNDIIKFKIHVQKSLEDYEGFVEGEVEQEALGEETSTEGVPVDE